MRVTLVAVGRGMPSWVAQGYQEYARRMPGHCPLLLKEVAPARGRSLDAQSQRRDEGRRLLGTLAERQRVVALDVGGEPWSTADLAERLGRWLQAGSDVSLLVGGAEGLDAPCLERAEYAWSLSRLTFPHMLVRVIVAEQLYRAWTILAGHPYHRDGRGGGEA